MKPRAKPPIQVLTSRLPEPAWSALRGAAPSVRWIICDDLKDAERRVPEADAALGFISARLLQRGKKLRWVGLHSAGVDGVKLRVPSRVVVTCSKGVWGTQMAEHALGLLLALTRQLTRSEVDPDSLARVEGQHLLVVGMGGTGKALAVRAKAMGMSIERAEKSRSRLCAQLSRADVVALCCPLTAQTIGLIGAKELSVIKPGARLINTSRGKLVVTSALVRALKSGRLAGAGLDVTEPEPLPPEHPLRQMPNVVLSPHVAATAPESTDEWLALNVANLKRFVSGHPLLNRVDWKKGY